MPEDLSPHKGCNPFKCNLRSCGLGAHSHGTYAIRFGISRALVEGRRKEKSKYEITHYSYGTYVCTGEEKSSRHLDRNSITNHLAARFRRRRFMVSQLHCFQRPVVSGFRDESRVS